MLTFDDSPKIRSEMKKTLIFNAQILEKTVFGLSDSVFGARTKVNMCFHSIFNKIQNDGHVMDLKHS